jgi:hypothetical protein
MRSDEEQEPAYCGEVQSVQSGETWRFADVEDVIAFLLDQVRQLKL